MAKDISGLIPKKENGGTTDEGRLTAKEWMTLVEAVQENQDAVKGAIKGIRYNKNTLYNTVDENGILDMVVADSSGRNVEFEFSMFSCSYFMLTPSNDKSGRGVIVIFKTSAIVVSIDVFSNEVRF